MALVALRPRRPPHAIITVYDPWGKPLTAGGDTVFEPEESPEFSGLYDADGNPLFRMPERHPIGFDLTPGADRQ